MSFYKLKHVSYLGLVVGLFLIGIPRSIGAQSENKKVLHNGIEREYFIHVPKKYNPNKSVPLVLAYHGAGDTAYMFMYYSGFNEISDENNFIVVYPQGTERKGMSGWNVNRGGNQNNVDDVDFTSVLIKAIKNNYNINLNRIYATGMSNGGFMSFLLACELPNTFAAVASVTGSMTTRMKEQCKIDRDIPILQMHGTDDKAVPYNGHPRWSLSINELVEFWTQVNGLNPEPKKKRMTDGNKTDDSYVERYIYRSKKSKTKVVHYKVIKGRHVWFGAGGTIDIKASEIIWDFFSEYSLQERGK